jgi:hypothetical protein
MAVRNSYANALRPISQLRELRGVVLFWKSADERGGGVPGHVRIQAHLPDNPAKLRWHVPQRPIFHSQHVILR